MYAGDVQQSVLVEYCTFVYILLYTSLYLLSTVVYPNSGTGTVYRDIVLRNKKRSLLCTPRPQWSELKSREIRQSTNHNNIGAASICSSVHSVQHFIIVEAYSCRAMLVFVHGQCVNEGKISTYTLLVSVLHWSWCCGATFFTSLANLIHLLRKNTLPFPAFGSVNFVSPPHRKA